jgi:catechol 2,3-dioxygenase-like lactoylglutathione lyase family enzyme
MKLYRVIVPVRDIESASAFYGEVFGAPGERVGENRHYFDCDGVVLACVEPRGRPFEPNPEIVYLSTDEPLETLRETWLGGGGTLDDDIRTREWGETSFYGRDPCGNQLCFVVAGTEFTGGRFVP